MLRRGQAFLTFCSMLGLLAAGPATASAKAVWLTTRTENFEMFSSASEDSSRQLLSDLVTFRSTLLKIMKLPPGYEPRCTIVLFDDEGEFESYKPRYNGKPKDIAGFFTGGNDAVMIALTPGRNEDHARRVVFHEYLHQLLFCHGLRLPVWLNEGLAEFFSTYAVKKDRVVLGTPVENHLRFLQPARTMPLDELFAVQEGSPDYNEGIRQGIFYAQSWALVHYLLCGKNRAYGESLNRYLQILTAYGREKDPGYCQVAGVDISVLERELQKYLRGGRYHLYALAGLDQPDSEAVRVTFSPAAVLDKECALLQLRWLSQRDPVCNYELLALTKRMPDSPRPYEALGGNAIRAGETDEAQEYWRRAAERNSSNPFIYAQVVRRPVHDLLQYQDLSYRLPQDRSGELRQLLRKALELDPGYGDAITMLALVEAFAEKPLNANINFVQSNAGKIRDARRFHLALAIVRWRVSDLETCRKLVTGLLAISADDPPVMLLARKLEQRLNQKGPG